MMLSNLRIPLGFRVTIAIGEASAEEQEERQQLIAAEPSVKYPPVFDMARARVEYEGQFVAAFSLRVESIDQIVEWVQDIIDTRTRPRLVP